MGNWLRASQAAKRGSEGFSREYLTVSENRSLDWFTKLAVDLIMQSTDNQSTGIAFMPWFEIIVNPLEAGTGLSL